MKPKPNYKRGILASLIAGLLMVLSFTWIQPTTPFGLAVCALEVLIFSAAAKTIAQMIMDAFHIR